MTAEPCWSTFELGKPGAFLRLHVDGLFHLLPYADLMSATLNEAESDLRLRFPDDEVAIQGQGLMPIFHQLQLANVRFLRLGEAEQEGLRIRKIVLASAEVPGS